MRKRVCFETNRGSAAAALKSTAAGKNAQIVFAHRRSVLSFLEALRAHPRSTRKEVTKREMKIKRAMTTSPLKSDEANSIEPA